MQLGSMLLCAVTTISTGFYASNALAEDSDDDNSDERKSDDEPGAGKSDDDDASSEKSEAKAPRFEIGITTTLASYSKLSFTLEIPTIGDTPGDITNTGFGPSANPVTLELGYLLSSQFSIGVLIEAGSTSTRTTVRGPDPLDLDETQTLGRLMIGPRLSYLFSESTAAVRPFVVAAVGFTYAPQTASAGARSLALTGFEAIGGLGLHWFLAPSFSLDAALRGGYGLGSGHVEETYPIGGTDAMGNPRVQTANVPVHGSLLTGAALIGASGWL